MTTQNITNMTKTKSILRNGLGVLLRVLEKISRHFVIDNRTMGSSGLMRDKWVEQQQRQFEINHRYTNIEHARNDRNYEK